MQFEQVQVQDNEQMGRRKNEKYNKIDRIFLFSAIVFFFFVNENEIENLGHEKLFDQKRMAKKERNYLPSPHG